MATLGKARQLALLRDIVKGTRDVTDLAREHRVSLEQLADWAAGPDVQRRLGALCGLADALAQVQVSRYRLFLVQGLLDDAMQEDRTDQTRKARLEALKLEVWQPSAAVAPPAAPAASAGEDDTAAAVLALLGGGLREGGDDAP